MARTKFKPFPPFKDFENKPYSLDSSFNQKNRAESLAKRYRKRGYYARVDEQQRGRRRYYCVYVRGGKRAEQEQERSEARLHRAIQKEQVRSEIRLERARTERDVKELHDDHS